MQELYSVSQFPEAVFFAHWTQKEQFLGMVKYFPVSLRLFLKSKTGRKILMKFGMCFISLEVTPDILLIISCS
jgi:hypothetical protein